METLAFIAVIAIAVIIVGIALDARRDRLQEAADERDLEAMQAHFARDRERREQQLLARMAWAEGMDAHIATLVSPWNLRLERRADGRWYVLQHRGFTDESAGMGLGPYSFHPTDSDVANRYDLWARENIVTIGEAGGFLRKGDAQQFLYDYTHEDAERLTDGAPDALRDITA